MHGLSTTGADACLGAGASLGRLRGDNLVEPQVLVFRTGDQDLCVQPSVPVCGPPEWFIGTARALTS